MNNTLDEQLRELERVNQDLERFGYSLSHDLRRSLRTIGSFSEILLEDTGSLDEEQRHMLARIGVATDRMSHIVDAMLELHRLGTGTVSRQAVDVGRLARSIARELEEQAPDRAIEWQLPEDALEDADEGLLMLALQNLLGNAVKFTGGRPRARVELGRQRLEDGRWEWFVRDNGVGFDMQAAARVFEPFQRLHDEQAFPGTGVGLATVAQVIRRHGGTIRAEGSPDDGAAFYFTLRPVPAPHVTPTPLAATVELPG